MDSSKVFKNIVKELKKTNVDTSEIDAQILLEFVTEKSREFLLANPDFELSRKQITVLNKYVKHRKSHEPIAYITGRKEFFDLDFFVTSDVLIPRPETEQLVEEALKFIGGRSGLNVLDVGTGCGNIIISLAKNVNAVFSASDISQKALNIAKKNAGTHGVKINFIESNLFEDIDGDFDLIIANLPYVPVGGSDNEGIKFEPYGAIFAGENGTMIIKKFLIEAKKHTKEQGMLLLEIDPRNAIGLKKFAERYFERVSLKHDFSKKMRILKILT